MRCSVCKKSNASFKCESCGEYYCKKCAERYENICECTIIHTIKKIKEGCNCL